MSGTITTTSRAASRSLYKERIMDIILGVPVFLLLTQPFVLNMHILGPAYFCALLPVRLRRSSGLVSAAAGIICMPNAQLRWKYGLIFLFLVLIDGFWRKWIREKQPTLYGICLAASLPMAVLTVWMIRQIDAYRFVMVLLEAVLFFGFIQLYERSLRILENQRYNPWSSLSENLPEISCLLGTLLAAISKWSFLYIAPWQIVHILAISIVVYKSHLEQGAVFTVITVVMLRLMGSCTEAYALLCLIFTLVSGYFRDMGRGVQVIAGMGIGLLFVILFMMQSRPYTVLIAIVLAQGIFGILPESIYQSLRIRVVDTDPSRKDTYMEQQFLRMETALYHSAKAMGVKPVKSRLSEKDMAFLCSDIAGRMCVKCENHGICWCKEFHVTYRVIGEVMQATQREGKICRKDISGDFLERCPQSDEFVRLVNRYFEIYRLNLSWENRLEKNMRLVSLQLESVAAQLKNLRNRTLSTMELEKHLYRKLSGYGYRISGIAAENDQERIRGLRIRLDQERTGKSEKQLKELLLESIGYDMRAVSCHLCGHKVWEWEFKEKLQYTVVTGAVSNGREPVNGDCYIRERLGYDRFLLALSDGMGTGTAARKVSALALSLLESLLAAGCSEEEAVSQLNLILLLHNREETYTTLDLGLLDLGSGCLTMVKAGGAISLIKSQGQVELLPAGTLPMGILDDIDPDIYIRNLSDGDLVLMMSDGILDQVSDVRQAELLLRKTVSGLPDSMGPQQIAETIYETMLEGYGSHMEDDITILAVRLRKET